MKSRVGIFSGSFDPIHIGHAMMVSWISQYSDLDEVWLMLSPQNPLKVGKKMTPDAQRMAMCRLVADDIKGVKCSEFELSLPKPTYTYRTLTQLSAEYPDKQFVLIIGSDNWLLFDKWRDYKEIIAEYEIFIYPRPGYQVAGELPDNVKLLEEAPQALISSTFIRDAIKNGKQLNYFIPAEVLSYIQKHKLYE